MSQPADNQPLAVEPQEEKTNLLGLSASRLEEFFLELGEKRFRATQKNFSLNWVRNASVPLR